MFDRIRGVNLSGWFILEPWVTPSLFAATGASNDGELQQVLGPAAYNERIREHYETFISELDFKRMSAMGLNAVRIPLPWYAFGSQNEHESYISCIDYIDRAMEWANKYEMKVLLDLATAPVDRGIPIAPPPPRISLRIGTRLQMAGRRRSRCSSVLPSATANKTPCSASSCSTRPS